MSSARATPTAEDDFGDHDVDHEHDAEDNASAALDPYLCLVASISLDNRVELLPRTVDVVDQTVATKLPRGGGDGRALRELHHGEDQCSENCETQEPPQYRCPAPRLHDPSVGPMTYYRSLLGSDRHRDAIQQERSRVCALCGSEERPTPTPPTTAARHIAHDQKQNGTRERDKKLVEKAGRGGIPVHERVEKYAADDGSDQANRHVTD
jgi:hypothetical protein